MMLNEGATVGGSTLVMSLGNPRGLAMFARGYREFLQKVYRSYNGYPNGSI